ncbi:MAG: thioesterase family protein [Acidimicrobiales bacterium]
MTGALKLWTGEVIEEWIDYNRHMSEGFYGLVFGYATDEYLLRMGFDQTYRDTTGGSFYTVETHITFLDELAFGTTIHVETLVVGVDDIRLHLFHELIRSEDSVVAATQESLLLHVNTNVDRVGPMRADILETGKTDARVHEGLGDPDSLGQSIRGPRPNN